IPASRCVKSLIRASSTVTITPSPIEAALPLICAAVWTVPPPSFRSNVTSALACPCPLFSLDLMRRTARCSASSRSTTSTVPLNVSDIAPMRTLISAFAASGLVRSTTLPPSTHGTMRSRSRIASQLYASSLPVEKEWSSSTIGLSPRVRVDRDPDLVGHLERPEQGRIRLDAPVGLLNDGAAGQAAAGEQEVERDLPAPSAEPKLAAHAHPLAVDRDADRAELDRGALEHLVIDRLLDVGDVVVAERLDSAGGLAHLQRTRVGRERHRRAVAQLERRLPRRDLDDEVVTGLGGGAGPLCPDGQSPVSRSQGRHQ